MLTMSAAGRRERPRQPDRAVSVRRAEFERARHAAGAHQNADKLRARRFKVEHHARPFGRERVVLPATLFYFL